MKKITISFVFLIVLGYIISGVIWGFNGLGAVTSAIILYFATNTKESNVMKEIREAREKDVAAKNNKVEEK